MLLLINGIANCQSEDFLGEFEALIDNENVQLLPDRMILSQKLIWGEKGLLRKTGISKLSIETGSGEFFSPARKLFQKFGFKPCQPFAHYKEDPNSCYYTKNID